MESVVVSSLNTADVLTAITSVISGITAICGNFVDKLVSNPFTIVIVSIAFISAGLGFILRLVRSC